ncbi:hypothetical protein CEN45_14820 [Fischerella thermalis CCMEE 5198]|uniref:hypothetical protein n=1 Tax=Fischerella thermalis TaxID=372787 RepID=UPI000C806744|nr:hypothetical protein [Fischerella thermalis]PMB06214.1 hypothetical protein CI594_02235 [Fischerella thermalis CCMEE 5196]PMB21420.1 hypothetical protein CEN45_14820 [Fischerella thermalis CCMEE 5198]PMB52749.1 hypothetical protein CEN39_08175 [Fischerella thermalis CCMEE 5201]
MHFSANNKIGKLPPAVQYHQVFEMASTGSFLVLAYIAYHLQLNSPSDRFPFLWLGKASVALFPA